MNENKKQFSEVESANNLLLKCYLALDIIFTIAYGLEFIKGERTMGYYLIFLLLAFLPYLAARMLYKKAPESTQMKRIVAYGYAAFYTFVIFTTVSELAFVYALPMFIAITLYADKAFTSKVGVGVIVVNLTQIGWKYIQDPENVTEHIANLEIQVMILVVCCVYLILLSGHFTTVRKVQVEAANGAKEQSEELLGRIMETAGAVANITENVSDKMNFLRESLTKTMHSMEEVNDGTSDTVNAVQTQLEMTEQIQKLIGNVEHIASTIEDNMSSARKELAAGNTTVEMLVEQVGRTNEAGEKATEELAKLDVYAKQMGSIINVIENVTEQTSLLALNASIEAARAGEAGKGFAVVASEISTLAGQTSNATVEITELINNISTELKAVVDVLNNLIEINKVQGEKASLTAENFKSIEKVTENIGTQSKVLTSSVGELASANSGIVESIQTISAITEEVTAHSNETYSSSEENDRTASEVTNYVNELSVLAQQLKQ